MSKTTSRVDSVASLGDTSGLQRRVLILAPFGRDASIVWQVLCAAGLEAEICAGVEQACAEIQRGAAAVVVAEEALADQARHRLTAALADEPAWSDLPLLILGSHVRPHGDDWPVLEAIEGTTYLVVLDRPLHTATLVSAVRVAVESRRRQYQVRDELAARRRAEEDLQRLNESLEQQVAERTAVAEQRARGLQRLAAELTEAEHRERQRLAKLLHDDLQQLLLAAKLRLPVLVEGPRDEIEHHVARIDGLLAECLSTSRNLTHELSPPVLQIGTLTEVMEWLAEWFGEKHALRVTVDAPASLPPVPDHLRVFFFQAVRELLSNIIKHAQRMEAWIGLAFQDGCLTVQVEDGGAGFDPESVAARIQRPEGFGLFNIQQRLDALGGGLEIRNGAPGGGCFRIRMPLADRDESRGTATEATPDEPRAEQVRVSARDRRDIRLLVVDDHPVVREGLAELLDRQEGLVVVGLAGDGAQAIAQAEALHPDAIIMDIEMPHMNGIEATRQIRQRNKDVIIVGLTLHQEGPASRAMAEAGADGYISKRALGKDMIAAIRRACGADSSSASSGQATGDDLT